MRHLVPPFLFAVFLSFSVSLLQAGETSIEAALEKARQRAGAPPSDSQEKKEKARDAAQQKAREQAIRKERDSAAARAKADEERVAADKTTTASQTNETGQTAKPNIKVFTLKDGRQIQAVMVVELDDTYALKDKDGKLEEVKKSEVQSIQNAE